MVASSRFQHVHFPALRGAPGSAAHFVAPSTPAWPVASAPPRESLGPSEKAFVRFVLAQIGIDVAAYRPETLARRFGACLRALRVQRVDDAWHAVDADRRRLDVAIDALLIGVSAFFRDRPVFEHLERVTLDELLSLRRPLRVWSAGCSDGAELYSLAILLGERERLDGGFLLGTDCRPGAVARARNGVFDDSSLLSLGRERRLRWLEPAGDAWRAGPALRAATRWWASDALTAIEPGIWDLITCRNFAIYLRADSAATLWRRLARALRRGGILVVGKAERPVGTRAFTKVGPGIFRRDGAAFVGA